MVVAERARHWQHTRSKKYSLISFEALFHNPCSIQSVFYDFNHNSRKHRVKPSGDQVLALLDFLKARK
jgi:hypothetical protein